MKKLLSILFITLCLFVGIYPFFTLLVLGDFGLLLLKSPDLLESRLYLPIFYLHVTLGGVALSIGWVQFRKKFRNANVKRHRFIGKLYVFSILISGLAGLYIALFANAGIIASLGFIGLGISWLYTTYQAYAYARRGHILQHRQMMYYSYALTCAAITFRLWAPILIIVLNDQVIGYQAAAWMCWLGNLAVAYFLVRRMAEKKPVLSRDAMNTASWKFHISLYVKIRLYLTIAKRFTPPISNQWLTAKS